MKNNYLLFLILLLLALTHFIFLKINYWELPASAVQQPIVIQGVIDAIPQKKFHGIKFDFQVHQFNHQKINTHFLLAWYQHPPHLRVGQRWQFTVKLKPPIGSHNPGGFDYVQFLVQKGISATGYVITRDDVRNHLLGTDHAYFIAIFREKIQRAINQAIDNKTIAAFVSALCVGLRDGLTESDWQVFQKTGTNHLVAIAGLHIGFVAAVSYACVNFLCRLFPLLLLRIPAMRIAEIAALMAAVGYSALSGFAIPAQRASIMLIVLMSAKLLYREISVWKRLFLALMIILIMQPYDLSDASLVLSFSAVSILAWVLSGRLQTFHGIQSWVRMQGAMVLGILPLTLLFFQQASVIAFFTNAIAIPWIGFLVLPLCLCACLLSLGHLNFLSHVLFYITGKVLLPLWLLLSAASQLRFASWYHVIPNKIVLLASIVGVIFVLAPRGLSGRWLGCFGLLPLFFYHPSTPKQGDYWVSVIDVGQGLSVLVQTAHHVLLYDTGGHIPGGFDFGESVISPYLRLCGVKTINRLEISHGDNDHSGGAAAIIKNFHVDQIFTSAPKLVNEFHAQYCVAGQSWVWDSVHFTTLNPALNAAYADNNSSCVIKVTGLGGQLLLTGDIEATTEFALVEKQGSQLHSTVLIAPHHGSRTSSSDIFLNAVSPHYAVISAGKYNRYHLPAESVVSRYAQHKIKLYNTADNGAVFIRFFGKGQVKLCSEIS